MKIDGNNQVLHSVQMERTMQESVIGQTKAAGNSQGVSFEKNRNDMLIEQAEQVRSGKRNTEGTDEQTAKSKLEILSNLVTERDLEQFKKHSEELEEEELDVIVTVVEKIKTQLATYCEDFDSGMVEDISSKELSKLSHLTGNAVHVAQKLSENNLPVTEENVMDTLLALEMKEQTGELTDSAKEYCMKADVELTIENLYMAMHSGNYEGQAGYYADGSGYYAKTADVASIEQLIPQIQRILAQAGMQVNDTTMNQAQWLIEKQLPLTKENLIKLQQLENISAMEADSQPENEVVLEHMIDALLDGKRPAQALVGEVTTVLERSQHAVSVLQSATDEQLQAVIASGQTVTIGNLEQAALTGTVVYQEEMNIQLVTARRQLEEIRLQMTVEAGVTMIRSGISVETESLQNLIEHLKQIEEQYYNQLLTGKNIEPSTANVNLYQEITTVRDGIRQAPADVIGRVAFASTRITMQAVYEEGTALEVKYHQANQAYEAVMTKPRSDMGDSIQKAFRNVDDILEDMGLEVVEANRRAVRILGYNSLEITQENIQRVKEADLEITSMLNDLKPSMVLEMIREGYNPLEQTAEEINQKIASMKAQTIAGEENFSEFLWNLEHSEGISQEERNAYIGIYRLMHQIEKSDGAVIGAVLEQGVALTMRNLMTGIRSNKHASMDYRIGEMDGVDGTKSASITEQIEKGYQYTGHLAEQIRSQMVQTDWSLVPDNVMDMSLEMFADCVRQSQMDETKGNGYLTEQLSLLNQAGQTEEQVLSFLQEKEQPITIANLLASSALFAGRKGLFGELKEAVQDTDEQTEAELTEQMNKMEEQFSDKEEAQSAYNKLLQTAQNSVQQCMDDTSITYERMCSWKLLSSQIHLATNLSQAEDYHIPVDIGGEWTSIHVQFVHSKESVGKVAISFETEFVGRINVEFVERNGALDGYIMTGTRQARELLAQSDDELRQQIEEASGLVVRKMDYAEYGQLDLTSVSATFAEENTSGSVSNTCLYQVAKSVIGFVKTAL